MDRELLEKIKNGELHFHEIDEMLNTRDAIELRRAAVSPIS